MREGVEVAGTLSVKGWLPQGLCCRSPLGHRLKGQL